MEWFLTVGSAATVAASDSCCFGQDGGETGHGGSPPENPPAQRSSPRHGLDDLAQRRLLYIGPEPPPAILVLRAAMVRTAPLYRLDAGLLADFGPEFIVTPLLCDHHDVIDVARRLETLGHYGPLRALSPPLPRIAVVTQEVSQVWRGGDFGIVIVPPPH